MKIRWTKSIRFQIFSKVAVLITFSTLGISLYTGRQIDSMLRDQVKANLQTIAEKTQRSVEESLNQWVSMTGIVAQSYAVLEPNQFKNQIAALARSHQGVLDITVLTRDKGSLNKGFSVQGPGEFPPPKQNSARREYDAMLPNLREVWGNSIFKEKLGASLERNQTKSGFGFLVLKSSFQFKNGRLAVVISLQPQFLEDILESNSNTSSWIYDSNNKPLLWSNGKSFQQANDFVKKPVIENLIKGTQTSGIRELFREASNPNVVAMLKDKTRGVSTFVEKDPSVDLKQLLYRVQKFSILTLLILWAVLGILFWALGRLTERIAMAIRVTSRIAAGDFYAQIKDNQADEVGVLSSSVNYMAKQLSYLVKAREEAVRQESELKTAKAFQQTLFPRRDEGDRRVIVRGYQRSASECAGDWWSYYCLPNGKILIATIDVTGHGASSALVGAAVFGFFECFALVKGHELNNRLDIQNLLIDLNKVCWEAGEGKTTMTLALQLLDSETGELLYVNAGHVPPMLCSKSENGATETVSSLVGGGSLIGMQKGVEFEIMSRKLRPGDRFVAFTDGLIECENSFGAKISKRDLRQLLKGDAQLSGPTSAQKLFLSIDNFFSDSPLSDDVTAVWVEYFGP